MRIVAAIPARNEEEAIGSVVRGCLKHCQKVVVIDDGSTDRTAETAKKAGAIVFSNKRSMGVGFTVRRCHEEALKLRPDIVVNLDGDGQHDPSEIPKMVEPIISGEADFVIGSRALGSNAEPSRIRKAGNVYMSAFISLLILKKITDAQSGYRAIKSEALSGMDLREKYTNRQEMIVIAARRGLRIKEIPIFVKKREHGKSFIQSFRKKFYFLLKVTIIVLKARFLRSA